MSAINPKIHASWKDLLEAEFSKEYFLKLKAALVREKQMKQVIYPPGSLIFNAFNLCPLPKLKVVILGQDPYHGPEQAEGLSFSVPRGKRVPPSLLNIYKEIKLDIGLPIPTHGNLDYWAKQGVFLLNAMLTVRGGTPASHQKIGWQTFTDKVIKEISTKKKNVVFILWGKFAQQKIHLVDQKKHLVLMSPHPSPFSADRGFFGSRHFSLCNEYLQLRGKKKIDWSNP